MLIRVAVKEMLSCNMAVMLPTLRKSMGAKYDTSVFTFDLMGYDGLSKAIKQKLVIE